MLKNFSKFHFILTALFLGGLFLRLVLITSVPNGMQQDETSIGYNAYSIAQTGKDEHNVSYPLYFQAFGEYKLPGYIYIDSLFIKFLGLNVLSVRLPSVLFGTFTIIGFYYLAKEIGRKSSSADRIVALLAAGLLVINPWHLHFSRGAFEVTLALFFLVYGILFLIKGLRSSKNIYLIVSVFCLSFSMYTYNITRLLAPMLLLFTLIVFREKTKKYKKNIAIIGAIFVITIFPLVFTLFSQGGISSTEGTIVFTSAKIQAELLEYRSYFVSLPSSIVRILFNQKVLSIWRVLQNMVSYVSADFFFINGSPHGNHGIGTAGQFYLFEIVTIGLGILSSYRTSRKRFIFMAGWLLLSVFTASLTREAPHATRSFFLLFPMLIFSAEGIYFFIQKN